MTSGLVIDVQGNIVSALIGPEDVVDVKVARAYSLGDEISISEDQIVCPRADLFDITEDDEDIKPTIDW